MLALQLPEVHNRIAWFVQNKFIWEKIICANCTHVLINVHLFPNKTGAGGIVFYQDTLEGIVF